LLHTEENMRIALQAYEETVLLFAYFVVHRISELKQSYFNLKLFDNEYFLLVAVLTKL